MSEPLVTSSLDLGMFRAALADHKDSVACYGLADQAEEQGLTELKLAWRFMGRTNTRPAIRQGARIRKPFGWYGPHATRAVHSKDPEYLRITSNPQSHLDNLLMQAMGNNMNWVVLFERHEEAVLRLGQGILKMKRILGEN